jgi:cytosine deaminase
MVTVAAAKAMNVPGFGLLVGGHANLVVFGQPDIIEALRFHAPPRQVVSHGQRVDLSRMQALVRSADELSSRSSGWVTNHSSERPR